MTFKKLFLTTVITCTLIFLTMRFVDKNNEAKDVTSSSISQNNTATDQANAENTASGAIAANTRNAVTQQPTFIPPVVETKSEIGIFDCIPANIMQSANESEEAKRYQEVEHYFDNLRNTGSPTKALHYALFSIPELAKPDTEASGDNDKNYKNYSNIENLLAFHEKFPATPLSALELIAECVNSQNPNCTNQLIEEAINVDSNNGAIWLNAISYYASNNDDENVLAAIESMQKTAFYNERFGERIALYIKALEGSSFNHFTMNAIAGIGYAAAKALPFNHIVDWCKKELDNSQNMNACMALGQQMESRGKTLITQTIGLNLQESVYTVQSKHDAIKLLQQRSEALYPATINKEDTIANFMIMLDERLLRSWLNNLDQIGEAETRRLLAKDAKALYKADDNYVCGLVYSALESFL